MGLAETRRSGALVNSARRPVACARAPLLRHSAAAPVRAPRRERRGAGEHAGRVRARDSRWASATSRWTATRPPTASSSSSTTRTWRARPTPRAPCASGASRSSSGSTRAIASRRTAGRRSRSAAAACASRGSSRSSRRFPEARINLEVKQDEPPIAEEVVRAVRRAGAERRVLLAAEDEAVLAKLRALDPGTALGSSLAGRGRVRARGRGGSAREPPRRAVTRCRFRPTRSASRWSRRSSWPPPDTTACSSTCGRSTSRPRCGGSSRWACDGVMSDFPARLIAAAR